MRNYKLAYHVHTRVRGSSKPTENTDSVCPSAATEITRIYCASSACRLGSGVIKVFSASWPTEASWLYVASEVSKIEYFRGSVASRASEFSCK